jgi:hypothetical protein
MLGIHLLILKTQIMRKTLFSLFSLSLFFMIGTASAQVVLPEVTITGARNVPERVDEAFKSTFKDAQDPVWYTANKNFLVKFINNDMKNNALFRKNGQLVYNISYGYEKDLPEEVSSLVKNRYKDYDVVVAFNVKQNERDIWVVNLENDKNTVMARVEEGRLDEASRTKKLQ